MTAIDACLCRLSRYPIATKEHAGREYDDRDSGEVRVRWAGGGQRSHRGSEQPTDRHPERLAGTGLRPVCGQARSRRCSRGVGRHLPRRPRQTDGGRSVSSQGRGRMARGGDDLRQSRRRPVVGRGQAGGQHLLHLHRRGLDGRLRILVRRAREEARGQAGRVIGIDRGQGADRRCRRPRQGQRCRAHERRAEGVRRRGRRQAGRS